MPSYEEVRQRFESEGKLEFFEQGIDDACNKIMRQTDYDKDTALDKLKSHNLDVMGVVREWMGVEPIKTEVKTSNQMVFAEFRGFLDSAARDYYRKRERAAANEAYIQQVREAARAELERRNASAVPPLEQVDVKVD